MYLQREGRRGFVVLLDVANHFSGQVGGGGEDSPGNDIALDFGKPDFNLIKPARIGWSVTDPDGWIGIEEPENTLGFMCAQVIGHEVNFSALRQAGHGLAQEVDKSALVCRAVVFPRASPVRVSRAAYSERVP